MAFPKHPRYRSILIEANSSARSAFFSTVGSSASLSPLPLPLPLPPCTVRRRRRSWSSQRPTQRQHHLHHGHCSRYTSPTASRARSFSTTTDGAGAATHNDNETSSTNNQLRIAIVGGGAAGMTTALHLSPLVSAGLIRGPVDVYESTVVKKSKNRNSGHQQLSHKNNNSHQKKVVMGGKQIYPGSGALGRDIGVGIWSTAWWPFLQSMKDGLSVTNDDIGDEQNQPSTLADTLQRQKNRSSYLTLLQDLEACGSYVKDVGYRMPGGGWLVKSELNASPFGIRDLLSNNNNNDNSTDENNNATTNMDHDDPALLFVREKDLLSCLRNAVKIEQRAGTIKYHSGVRVDGIENVRGDMGSLVLRPSQNNNRSSSNASATDPASPEESNDQLPSPQYNLIIAADGIYSPLRSRFAGHRSSHATGTGIESSSSHARKPNKETLEYKWEHTKGQLEATQVEDRKYIVFRGNAPKLEGGGLVEEEDEDVMGSFQTWGEERSMRFAAVPFYHETEDLEDEDEEDSGNGNGNSNNSNNSSSSNNSNSSSHYSKSHSFISKKKDEEVWFATISDPAFLQNFNSKNHRADEQKRLLLEAFGSWHAPVKTLIETTPAENIMYEMAVAHSYNTGPVFDVARIMEFESWQKKKKESSSSSSSSSLLLDNDGRIDGRGPILAFIGDSYMTVDPVLAQGFTMAMESGASIVESIEQIMVTAPPSGGGEGGGGGGRAKAMVASPSSSLMCPIYRPKLLRQRLLERQSKKEQRLIQLLRSTELVQIMAQPRGPLGSMLATWIVRPAMRLCPESVKKTVFDYMIRYSLGLTGGK